MKERLKNILHNRKPVVWVGLVGILVCVVIAVCLMMNSCDSLRVIKREPCTVVYKSNFGHLVHGGEIRAEMWTDGECVRTAPVNLTEDVQEIYVAMRERKEEFVFCGVDIEIRTEQKDGSSDGSLLSYFPFPEDKKVQGYLWDTYELKQKVKVHPGEEKILSAMSVDTGCGVRTFDGEVLLSEPERLEEADCMIVIRATFDDKEHLSEIEEPTIGQEK